jgi:Ankyrin repeat
MTQICVEFLCFEEIRPTAQRLVQKFAFYEQIDHNLERDNYVESLLVCTARYWPCHLRDAEMAPNESSMANISQLYDTDNSLYGLWFAIFWKATSPYERQPYMDSIRLAALLRHGKMLELMLQFNWYYDINKSDMAGRTALIWESRSGHEKIVHMLLERGAEVNAPGGSYGNALYVASIWVTRKWYKYYLREERSSIFKQNTLKMLYAQHQPAVMRR